MLKKLMRVSVAVVTLGSLAYAGNFDAQAEKDRIALQKYFVKKFEDPIKNKAEFFPYVSEDEIKANYIYPIKLEEFVNGNAAWYKPTRDQFAEINDFPPYEIPLDEGEELFNTAFKNGKTYSSCFPDTAIKQNYPYFNEETGKVVTLGLDINACRVKNGEEPLKYGKNDIARLSAYFALKSRGKKINVEIKSAEAEAVYNKGKKLFYKQTGTLGLNCAECHVQGSGQKIRQEGLSPILGGISHFPTFRIKYSGKSGDSGLGTVQRRLQGCLKDTGLEKEKMQSENLRALEYFVTYMSNGLKLNGPDTRK